MTSGPDKIPSFLIKDCAGAFVIPLTKIINLSIQQMKYPELWKEARVCPIFKAGVKSEIENYRAVSILSNFSKVFEIVLYNRILSSVQLYISSHQHGFVNKRSTVTNLVYFTQYLSEVIDDNGQVDDI
uniref:Uncharacterized protein LOC114348917 n=1 Tax=Diabrotica virgifera virgifera TaxID=50390 RepID=A0A6P7H956_DIAVI